MSRASAPAGLCPSVRPAESSTSTPHRSSSADTRRAIDGSGVMRAAVLPGVSSVSRIAIASARASSVSLSATTIVTSASAAATAGGDSAPSRSRQRSVDSAGRSASVRNAERAASAGAGAPRGSTSSRSTPISPISRRMSALRMAGEPERGLVARADHGPGAVVEIEVEVGQHDRALRARGRSPRSGGRWRDWRRSSRR